MISSARSARITITMCCVTPYDIVTPKAKSLPLMTCYSDKILSISSEPVGFIHHYHVHRTAGMNNTMTGYIPFGLFTVLNKRHISGGIGRLDKGRGIFHKLINRSVKYPWNPLSYFTIHRWSIHNRNTIKMIEFLVMQHEWATHLISPPN